MGLSKSAGMESSRKCKKRNKPKHKTKSRATTTKLPSKQRKSNKTNQKPNQPNQHLSPSSPKKTLQILHSLYFLVDVYSNDFLIELSEMKINCVIKLVINSLCVQGNEI